jgi:hypothetical protein
MEETVQGAGIGRTPNPAAEVVDHDPLTFVDLEGDHGRGRGGLRPDPAERESGIVVAVKDMNDEPFDIGPVAARAVAGGQVGGGEECVTGQLKDRTGRFRGRGQDETAAKTEKETAAI